MIRQDLFIHVVNNLNGGAQNELSDRLSECVKATQDTGKATELTFTLKIKPDRAGGQYFIDHAITTKLPKHERPTTIMWADPQGNLLREDPRQRSLELRSVDQDKTELKSTGDDKPALKNVQ